MPPRSRTLFHFTKSLDTLKLILSEGFWPRYCAEDTRWHGQIDAQSVAFPMVCFCDIPLSRISDHVNFYGQYGLGMTREWATVNGLNPILYLAGENSVMAALRKLNAHASTLAEKDRDPAKKTTRYVYSHTKPVSGVMIVDGAPVEKDFYLESEWRYVPQHDEIKAYLRHTTFTDTDRLKVENEKTSKHCRLKFTPKDIKYIFVRSDADIPEIINFIQIALDHYPHADTKVLMSRVTSLESIQGDV
jgi:Putative abortive phage resistance protein AbiGi, antitoxin